MNKVFIICGYGVPKNIFKDKNYNFYLKSVFNYIFDASRDEKIKIIFSGGLTDCFKPYKRIEAKEMIKLFDKLARRPKVAKAARAWQLLADNQAVSTLENLLKAKNIIFNKGFKSAAITIFCEYTRTNRVKRLAKKIFTKKYKVLVKPVDFDISANRYLSQDFLYKKEAKMLSFDLWALKSRTNLLKHHNFFKDKLTYLRKIEPAKHVEAIEDWWKKNSEVHRLGRIDF